MLDERVSDIKTNYFKIGHVKNVQYTIYTTTDNNEQKLLELELSLRHQNPSILLTYYNKCLFHFLLDETSQSPQSSLIESDPTVSVKLQATVATEKLANPPKTSDNEEYLAFANISFLRSLKKMVLYNLSISQVVKVFGSHCVASANEVSYRIIYIDPLLLANGDLLISCVERRDPQLYNSSVLLAKESVINQTFVVYILPSGIRCHLFDPTNLNNNFVTKPQFENEQLLRLLELSTGIENLQTATWVRLIPNLKHLNNQTSPISKFVHTVENKKYILWPWSLCLLQFGLREKARNDEQSSARHSNPMNLLSDFLDFNIEHKAELERAEQQHLSLPPPLPPQHQLEVQRTSLSGDNPVPSPSSKQGRGIPSTGSSNTVNETSRNLGPLDIGINTPLGGDIFNLQVADNFFSKPENSVVEEKSRDDNDDDMEIDELFGGDQGESEDGPVVEKKSSSVESRPEKSDEDESDALFGSSADSESPDADVATEKEFSSNIPHSNSQPKKVLPYIDILSTGMTVGNSQTPDYSDPGAPAPINPTPMMYPSKKSAESTLSRSHNNGDNATDNGDGEVTDKSRQTLFSPLAFHPVIKKDIDMKYGKGGKFYFNKDVEGVEKIGVRATSVSGASPSSLREIKKQRVSSDHNSDSEESDEDEESDNESRHSEEQRDVFHQSGLANATGANTVLDFNAASAGPEKSSIFTPMLPTGGFGSPYNSNFGKLGAKPDSPLPLNEIHSSMTPAFYDPSSGHQSPQVNNFETKRETETANKSSEASNFLPLILRSVNVSTIPGAFLMNNLVSERLIPAFSMTEDEGDNDLETTNNDEMIVKLRHLKELLNFVSSNVVFDLGATLNLYSRFIPEYGRDLHLLESNAIEYQTPTENLLDRIKSVFPLCYQICLSEFVLDNKCNEENDILDGELNFLEHFTDIENSDNPKGIMKELDTITWNSSGSTTNQNSFEKYNHLVQKLNAFSRPTEDNLFKTRDVKVHVNKNGSLINLNSVGLEFWNYLDFGPVGGHKNFQMLAIGESSEYESSSYLHTFTDRLINNYTSCNFGSVSRLNLSTVDTRPDLDPVTDGVMLVAENSSHNHSGYSQVNKKLNSLAELIKLDLINKTNNFEFDRPLLVLFINFDESFNSTLQISKVLRNFKVALLNFQVPLVQIFAKIIPASMISKKVGSEIALNLFNNYKLSRISMSLYNECPVDEGTKLSSCQLYAPLVKEPPLKIPFKFINSGYRDISGSDDTFIHVAYERSIDKSWFAAAWTDPLGLVKHTKSWYCSLNSGEANGVKSSHNFQADKMDVASIADDIWDISLGLFSALSRVNERENSTAGKKFLVLTRINSVIPDDELVHWKRLSMRYKDVSLIVLSVNRTPKMTLSLTGDSSTSTFFSSPERDKDGSFSFRNPNNVNNTSPNTSSGGSVHVTSPNGLTFHSPQQFLNVPSNFMSPQDLSTPGTAGAGAIDTQGDPDAVLKSADGEIFGMVPLVQLPSFNSPSRMNMKTGYLIKEQAITISDNEKRMLVFEVNLLSCSNYWNLDTLMKLILRQYKNLTVLNDILGMRSMSESNEHDGAFASPTSSETACLVPWHINAVGKLVNYLVHIYVEE
ncbi:SSN2 [Candida margitis]|uniref:SSN2 n=1 Tax=Candida margitis TaxID=1775924 RepID=UPI002227038A|nr:SSN2 [Candida margitis]KAI5953805.1 SSN2 [Candida margitis]